MNKKLEYLSALEIGELVNNREITPTEILDYFFKRIEDRNKDINAVVYLKKEEAYQRAKELEERLNKGEYIGPFAGVPFLLKDFLPSKKGWTNSKGGVKSLISVDEDNSTFCTAMEEAGGIAIGKSNAPSFGFRGTTDNKLYGPTSTPFNVLYNAGGSSGGSASAIADGLVPIAEGGDAGGSIRIPASYNNCFGYKASIGTIPDVTRPDAFCATHPYCFNGGITKTVKDSATLLNYMAKYDPRDPLSRDKGDIDYLKEIKKDIFHFKIGYTLDFDMYPVEEEIKENFLRRIEELKKAGFNLEEVHFKFHHSLDEFSNIWLKSISVDTAIEFKIKEENGFKLIKEDYPEEFLYWKDIASNLGIMDFYNFNLAKTDVYDAFNEVLSKYDLILSPVAASMQPLNTNDRNTKGIAVINGVKVEPLIGFAMTYLINFIGNPSASIPLGIGDNNLPIGLQIIGRRYKDEDVLAFSYQYEKLFPWEKYYDIAFRRN